MCFLCGIFVDLPARHIKSKSLGTLYTSPNHWVFIIKLRLGHAWCTGDQFLVLTCASNIFPLSFMCLNF